MHAENWKTIKHTLLEALKLDQVERRSYLDGLDITANTREEVESLLRLEAESKDFMSLSVGEFATGFLDQLAPPDEAIVNQRIGAYEVVAELGCGGMGAVYLARRADGKFEQQVAVKMLKREFNTEKIRLSFKREKEILATLAHPNIATLLDAGTTPDGIPYLVMEYIKGQPIDEFCQSRTLSLNARLKLFNKVSDAVAFAHRNLIVHRDLKPSNILVTEDGEPKLLDFGISKLLDAKSEDANQVTQMGALTPQYASPEQIQGKPVTTATDVYSLGVVLFKILTGNFPYEVREQTNGTLFKEITENPPALPSESTRDPIHSSALKGDLDNIILKSLRKEPEQRYQSVEQFSADIWRFVDGMPVLARAATFSYRARKFYGRNKVPVLGATLIVVSLFVGIAISLSQANAAKAQARIAAEAERQAQLETSRAKAEKQKAERTSRFMQSFLNYANPHWVSRGQGSADITVREALDDAVARMETELADAPELRADLHYTVGEVYRTHDEADIALRHFRQSLDLYRQVHGEHHPKVARGIYYVTLFEASTEAAEPVLRQAVAMMRETDPDNVNLPYMLQSLASWIMTGEKQNKDVRRLAEVESLILEARTLFTRHYGTDHGATLTTGTQFAKLAHMRGDLALAESIREENLRLFRQAGEGEHNHIWALFYLAEAKLALGNNAEAETLFRQALDLARRKWGPNHFRVERLARNIRQARAAAS